MKRWLSPRREVACADAQGRTARQPGCPAAGHASAADARPGGRAGSRLRGHGREPAPHVRARQGGAARARRAGRAWPDRPVGQRRGLFHRPERLRHAPAGPGARRARGAGAGGAGLVGGGRGPEFEVPDWFDASDVLPTAGEPDASPIATVRAGRAAARLAELRGAKPDGEEGPDGRVTLRMPIVDREGFVDWAIGNGIEVVEPEELRTQARRRLEGLLALLGGNRK